MFHLLFQIIPHILQVYHACHIIHTHPYILVLHTLQLSPWDVECWVLFGHKAKKKQKKNVWLNSWGSIVILKFWSYAHQVAQTVDIVQDNCYYCDIFFYSVPISGQNK